MAEIKIIDISAWNDITNYSLLKSDGVQGAILKAIRKDGGADKKFSQHYNGCKNAGIPVIGTYHYSYSTTVSQAKTACQQWINLVGNKADIYFLDWEDSCLPKNKTGVDIINTYANMVISAGYKFAVYTGKYLYSTYLRQYKNQLPYDFWIARYYSPSTNFAIKDSVNNNYIPNIENNLVGWQYTSNAHSSGCNGKLDCSVWYKDITQKTITQSTTQSTTIQNPFSEPTKNVKLGTLGNDANWTLWCLWRFGLCLDKNGKPDTSLIDGTIGVDDVERIKTAQKSLGLDSDGIVGKQTRAIFRKFC